MTRVWSWHITIHIYSEPVKQRWQWGGVSRCGLNCRVTSATPCHHPARPSISAAQHLNTWPRFLSWRCLKQRCAVSSIYNCTQATQISTQYYVLTHARMLEQVSVLWMLQMLVYTRSFRYDPDHSCQQTITTTTSALHPSSYYHGHVISW